MHACMVCANARIMRLRFVRKTACRAIFLQYDAIPSFFCGIKVRIHLQFAELFQSYLFPTLFYHSDSSDVNVFHMQMEYAHEKI